MLFAIALILIIHIPFLNISTMIFLLHLGIISVSYNIPFSYSNRSLFTLRSLPFLKIFLIAYVWASISAFLPKFQSGDPIIDSDSIAFFASYFFYILAITLPFDIRDYYADQKISLSTIPHLLGKVKTKILSMVCLSISSIIIWHKLEITFFIMFLLITSGLILYASPKRKPHYYLLFMDGSIILYYLTILLSLNKNLNYGLAW